MQGQRPRAFVFREQDALVSRKFVLQGTMPSLIPAFRAALVKARQASVQLFLLKDETRTIPNHGEH